MSKHKMKTLAALVRLDLEKAKRRFKKIGEYEIDIWHDEPKSALETDCATIGVH